MIKLSDEELICGWMEKRPTDGRGDKVETENVRWWDYNYQVKPKKPGSTVNEFHWQWHPINLTLDRIWEVEEKIPEKHRLDYWHELTKGGPPELGYWRILHAPAEIRIAALARLIKAAL